MNRLYYADSLKIMRGNFKPAHSHTGTFAMRNSGLFMLGVSTGRRISELLSLQIGDVYQNGKAVTDLLFDKSIVKGGEISRAVPVNRDGRRAIEDLIGWHREKYGKLDVKRPLFPSRNKSGTVAMNRQTAHEMLKKAFEDTGLNGKLATHSRNLSIDDEKQRQPDTNYCRGLSVLRFQSTPRFYG